MCRTHRMQLYVAYSRLVAGLCLSLWSGTREACWLGSCKVLFGDLLFRRLSLLESRLMLLDVCIVRIWTLFKGFMMLANTGFKLQSHGEYRASCDRSACISGRSFANLLMPTETESTVLLGQLTA